MKESEVENVFVRLARAHGLPQRKGKWIGHRGAPDRVLLDRPNKCVRWVELKRPGEVPDENQEKEHRLLRNAGQDVRVIDSVEGVKAFFKEITSKRCGPCRSVGALHCSDPTSCGGPWDEEAESVAAEGGAS